MSTEAWTTSDESATYPTYQILLLRSMRSLELIGKQAQDIDTLRAENARLREALEAVFPFARRNAAGTSDFAPVAEMVRAALAKGGE